jgi:hypothetical protein
MENDALEDPIGQIVITLYKNNTFSIGSSVTDVEEILDILDSALTAVESGELDGLEDFKKYGGTIQ